MQESGAPSCQDRTGAFPRREYDRSGPRVRSEWRVRDFLPGIPNSELGFEILNFGAGRKVSVKDVVATLEKALGVSARIDWQPRQTGDVGRTWADIGP